MRVIANKVRLSRWSKTDPPPVHRQDEYWNKGKREIFHDTYCNEHIWLEFRCNSVGSCSDNVVNVIVCRPDVYWLSHCARSRELSA